MVVCVVCHAPAAPPTSGRALRPPLCPLCHAAEEDFRARLPAPESTRLGRLSGDRIVLPNTSADVAAVTGLSATGWQRLRGLGAEEIRAATAGNVAHHFLAWWWAAVVSARFHRRYLRSRFRFDQARGAWLRGGRRPASYDERANFAFAMLMAESAQGCRDIGARAIAASWATSDLPSFDDALAKAGTWAAVIAGVDVPEQRGVLSSLVQTVRPVRVGYGRYEVDVGWTPLGEALARAAAGPVAQVGGD